MELLAKYKNGNYEVTLYDDGTKELFSEDDEFYADFPDCIDLKITNNCDLGCPMCHEKSTSDGLHANIDFENSFLGKLHTGTELAIGGGNPLSHPKLEDMLKKLKEMGIVCNLTINEIHLHRQMEFVEKLINEKLIYGLGVSLSAYSEETFKFANKYSNTILHGICGLLDVNKLFSMDCDNLKLLLLGYKNFGRGKDFYSDKIKSNIKLLSLCFPALVNKFKLISFDNLALEQLKIKDRISDEIWNERYMGDDGTNTMYIDLVNRKFAINSTSENRYDLLNTADEMLKFIQKQKIILNK